MAIDANTMVNALNKARKLCQPEGQQMINEASKNMDIRYDDVDYESYLTSVPSEYMQPQASSAGQSGSKLPKAIMESMMSNPIDTSSLDPNGMNVIMREVEKQIPTKQSQVIKEEKIISASSVGVDYALIKQIVEECIDRKFKTLTENNLKGIRLKEGKIALVDNSGNVFQATLEYKGKSKK
jgi:hypothetical protein